MAKNKFDWDKAILIGMGLLILAFAVLSAVVSQHTRYGGAQSIKVEEGTG